MPLYQFEHKDQPLLSNAQFAWRMAGNSAWMATVIAFSLFIGSAGYHYFGSLGWVDAFYNASLILTGMGPVDKLQTVSAKLFASFYSLYSGVTFLTSMAVLAAPIFHRVLHKFHLADESDAERD